MIKHYYVLSPDKIRLGKEALEYLAVIHGRFKQDSPVDLSCLLSFDTNCLTLLRSWAFNGVAKLTSDPELQLDATVEFPQLAYYFRHGRKNLASSPDILLNLLMIALDIKAVLTSFVADIATWKHGDEQTDQFLLAANWASTVIRKKFGWTIPDKTERDMPPHVQEWYQRVEQHNTKDGISK